jgi:antitoxin MazE
MTTKITKWGNSYGVRIPKEIISELNLSEGVEFDMNVVDGGIQIKPITGKKKYSLEELLAQIPADYVPEIVDWGPDVGNEILEPWEGIVEE